MDASSTKMNPEIKSRWVAALRSGEYKQTTGRLRRDGGMCCLGVLTDLAVRDGVAAWISSSGGEPGSIEDDTGEVRISLLPNIVARWAGLPIDGDQCGPKVSIQQLKCALAEHNDSGRTFAEIADAIESQL